MESPWDTVAWHSVKCLLLLLFCIYHLDDARPWAIHPGKICLQFLTSDLGTLLTNSLKIKRHNSPKAESLYRDRSTGPWMGGEKREKSYIAILQSSLRITSINRRDFVSQSRSEHLPSARYSAKHWTKKTWTRYELHPQTVLPEHWWFGLPADIG